jgi:hypothetical protein
VRTSVFLQGIKGDKDISVNESAPGNTVVVPKFC